jgi:hypothetical protein
MIKNSISITECMALLKILPINPGFRHADRQECLCVPVSIFIEFPFVCYFGPSVAIFFYIFFLVCPIWLPVFSFFSNTVLNEPALGNLVNLAWH